MLDLLFFNKTVKQTLVKNTFWLILGEAIGRFSKFFLVMAAARVLQPEGYGNFNYLIAFIAVFFEFSDIGLSDFFIREYQKTQTKNKIVATFFLFKFSLLVFITALCLGIGYLYLETSLFTVFLIVLGMTLVDKVRNTLILISNAKQEMQKHAGAYLVETVSTTVIGIAFLYYFKTLSGFCLAYLLGSILALISAWVFTKKDVPHIHDVDKSLLKPIIAQSWPFSVTSFLRAAFISTDTLLIARLMTQVDVGYYSVGFRIFRMATQTLGIFVNASYPMFCALQTQPEELHKLVRKVFSLIMLASLPVTVLGIVLAKSIIVFVFGELYLEATFAFQCFMLLIPFGLVVDLLTTLCFASGRQVRFMVLNGVGTALNICVSYVGILKFGIIGAILGTLFANILIIMGGLVSFKIKWVYWNELLKIIFASICAGVVATLGQYIGIHIIGTLIMGGIVYAILLLALKERNSYNAIKELWSKKRALYN